MADIGSEIVAAEHAYWRAVQAKDVDGVVRMTHDACLVAGARGIGRIEPKALGQMLGADTSTLRSYEFLGEPLVQQLGDDVAVIAYRVREELVVDGKPLTLEAFETSTWIRRDGQWRCALHAETHPGDSYGRDRKAHRSEAAAIPEVEAHANLAVKDLARAKEFYEHTLGLTPVHDEGGHLIVYKSGSSTLNVYQSEYAGTNQATAVTWSVSNLESVVRDLRSKGVTFEDYGDMPGMKREGDVYAARGMKVAWFKDPDGNILNLVAGR